MYLRLTWLTLTLVATAALSAEIEESLPAGGKYIHQTKWDKVTILCTADPVTPVALTRVCTCLSYDEQPWLGQWRYRLRLATLLSNGKTAETPLADGLASLNECTVHQAKHFQQLCSQQTNGGSK